MSVVELNADWSDDDFDLGHVDTVTALWWWEVPTDVQGFEVEGEPNGFVESLMVGNRECLMVAPIPVAVLCSAERVHLPTVDRHVAFQLRLRDFTGRIRPKGRQLSK